MKRNEINELLTKIRLREDLDRQFAYKELEEKYGIPINVSAGMLATKKDFAEINDQLCYCFVSVLAPDEVERLFTKKEIATLSKGKWERNVAKFPLIFHGMRRVAPDQWIGAISLHEFMALRDAGLINYNPETQRPLKVVINGESVTYRIFINWKAVREIKELMLSGNYIPDDITLNIPYETDYSYAEDGTFRIAEIEAFDIIDGYHRYLAMCQIYNENPEFDMQMELRITQFATEKAQQLIYQKDQKTLMRKSASKTYDQLDAANAVAKRLNLDPRFNLHGEVGRNNVMIQIEDLAILVKKFWMKQHLNKRAVLAVTLQVEAMLRDKINLLTEADPKYLTEPYSFSRLLAVVFAIWKEVPDDKFVDVVNHLVEATESMDPALFRRDRVTTKTVNELERVLEECNV